MFSFSSVPSGDQIVNNQSFGGHRFNNSNPVIVDYSCTNCDSDHDSLFHDRLETVHDHCSGRVTSFPGHCRDNPSMDGDTMRTMKFSTLPSMDALTSSTEIPPPIDRTIVCHSLAVRCDRQLVALACDRRDSRAGPVHRNILPAIRMVMVLMCRNRAAERTASVVVDVAWCACSRRHRLRLLLLLN